MSYGIFNESKINSKKISKLSKHLEAYFQPQNHRQKYSKNKLENITLSIYLRITSTDLHLSFVMHICTAASDTVHYSKIQGSYRPSALPHIQTLNWRHILGDGKTPLWSILYYLILLGKITPHHISIFTASRMTFFFPDGEKVRQLSSGCAVSLWESLTVTSSSSFYSLQSQEPQIKVLLQETQTLKNLSRFYYLFYTPSKCYLRKTRGIHAIFHLMYREYN